MSMIRDILQDSRCQVYAKTLRDWEEKINALPWRDQIRDSEAEAFLRACAFARNQQQAEFVISRLNAPGGSEAGVIVLGLGQGKSGAFMSVSDVAERLLLKKPPALDLSPTDPRVVGLRIERFSPLAFARYYEKHRGVTLSRLDVSEEIRNPDLVYPYRSSPDDVFSINGTRKVVIVDYKSPSYTQGSMELFVEKSGQPTMYEYRAQIQLYARALEALGYEVEDRIIFNFGFEGAPGMLQGLEMMRETPSAGAKELVRRMESEIDERILYDIDTERYEFCRYSMSSFQRDDALANQVIDYGKELMQEYVMRGKVPSLLPSVPDMQKKAAARSILTQYKLARAMQDKYASIVKELSGKVRALGSVKSDLGSVKLSRKINKKRALDALEAVGFDVDSIVCRERQEPKVKEHVDEAALESALVDSGLDPAVFCSEATRITPSRARSNQPVWEVVENIGYSLSANTYEQALDEVALELDMPELKGAASGSAEHRQPVESGNVPEMI